jgi:DNA-binding transcriptional regulator YdaS (Cro superfamily)
MADRIITVLTPATSFDLMTLSEAKMLMGISPADTTQDTALQFFIDVNSQIIARLCNRTFAREEVREEWRELNGGTRIFPSHWPIQSGDIESVESPLGTVLDPTGYELEEESGKIELIDPTAGYANAWAEPVIVTYWGGYMLPGEAPLPLKQACTVLNIQSKLLASLGLMGGMRLLSHKEKRVAFHDPLKILEAAMGAAGKPNVVMGLLDYYIRLEV